MKRITTLLLAFVLVLALVPAIALATMTYEYTADVSADSSKVWYVGDTVTESDITIGTVSMTATDDSTEPPTTATTTMSASEYTVELVNADLDLASGQLDGINTVAVKFTKNSDSSYMLTKYLKLKVYQKPVSLTVKTAPTKAYVGQNISDLKTTPTFTLTFEDGTSTVVEADSFSVTEFPSAGTVTVTASVKLGNITVTADFDVTVTEYLDHIELNAPTEAYIDESTASGATVTAYFADGSSSDVTSDCTFDPESWTTLGSSTVKVSYTKKGVTKEASATVDVKEWCTGIAISNEVTEAYVGDTPAFTATATYDDGSTKDVTGQCDVTPASYSASGTVAVEVKYTDSLNAATYTETFTVTVKEAPTLEAKLSSSIEAKINDDTKIVVGDPIRDASDKPVFTVTYGGVDVFEKCTMEPATQNFTKAGKQIFTFKYSDPDTGKQFTSKCEVEVFEPVEEFKVEGEPTLNYAGEIFDPEEMPGLNYSVTYYTSAVLDQKAGTDIVASENWAHERIKWTSNVKLAFGDKNNEVTFSYTDPLMSNALYVTKTISGLSVVKSVTVSGTPKFFIGETFRDDILRSIDKLGVTIDIVFEDGYGDPITITRSTDKALSQINIPNIEMKEGESGTANLVYTEAKTGSITKSNTISYNPQDMCYYYSGKTNAPTWVGTFSKTAYSEGQYFSTNGVKLVLTNFWGEKETVTSGFLYDIRTKKTTTTAATFKAADKLVDRALKVTDDRVRLHYFYLGLDGNVYDAFNTAYKKSTGKKGIMYTNITVTKRTLSKIQITTQPDKLSYEIGETFDTTGMVVTAVYTNGTKEKVTTYTFEPTTAFKKADVGSFKVVITYQDGTVKKSANVWIVVNGPSVPSQTVVLNTAQLNLVASETAQLSATVYPTNATNRNVTWSSSDVTVATVDDEGVVKAVGEGSCVISATTVDYTHRYADCYVVVEAKTAVTKVKLDTTAFELLLGDSTTLNATIKPDDATVTTVKWTSSNESVVSVDQNGKVKGLKVGEAIITATCDGVSGQCAITVVKELTYTGTVYNCSNSVNVRKSASTSASVIGTAAKGNKYKVLGKSSDGKWYKIQYTSSKVGYIYYNYLKVTTKAYVADSTSTEDTSSSSSGSSTTIIATKLTIVNCQRYCYVRKGPATSTASLGHATLGSTYTLLGVSGDWYIINYDGQQGYVSSAFAQLS